MKVTTLTLASGTYAQIATADFELSVKLPNGNECIAADLERLACEAEVIAARHVKQAQRLRAAINAYGAMRAKS